MIALVAAVIACVVSYLVGVLVLGWAPRAAFWAMVASNIAAYSSLPLTLLAERVQWVKRVLIPGMLRTWALLAIVYVGVLLALVSELRTPRDFSCMILPLIFCSGFMIFSYGFLHDFLVRRTQKRVGG
jgi:hypothetical protein